MIASAHGVAVGEDDAAKNEAGAGEMESGDALAEKRIGEAGGEQRHEVGEEAGAVGAGGAPAAVPAKEGDHWGKEADIKVAHERSASSRQRPAEPGFDEMQRQDGEGADGEEHGQQRP